MTANPEGQTMLEPRTLEILAAIQDAATCTPDLRQVLEATRVEAQADHVTTTTEVKP